MTQFGTKHIDSVLPETAPDGSQVRSLMRLSGGSMAQFNLAPGQVSAAIVHRTVDEIWYVVAGAGELWREQAGREETTTLGPGLCISLPCSTRFQFRAAATTALKIIAVTMPPWPDSDEAMGAEGPWPVGTD